jgi:hypothetical protein
MALGQCIVARVVNVKCDVIKEQDFRIKLIEVSIDFSMLQ